jgi:putative phosphoribosyl transferase
VAVAALDPYHTVSHWYEDFAPTSDEEVCGLLGVAPSGVVERPAESNPERAASIPVTGGMIKADLSVPPGARSVVLLAHGSGSTRRSYRNRYTAATLREEGFGTLLLDLLTREEQVRDARTAEHRFDVELLAERLVAATDWLLEQPAIGRVGIGYVGASTGGTAALMAAAERPAVVAAVVTRGGRADLAAGALRRVEAPTLFIVGERDEDVLAATRQALARIGGTAELALVPDAGHAFEEPGALGETARLAAEWLQRWLPAVTSS